MTNQQIIDGFQFTIDMFLFDPSKGEVVDKHRLNDENKLTVDACEEAIKILKAKADREEVDAGDCISRQAIIDTNICDGISCNECPFNKFNKTKGVDDGCLLYERLFALPSVSPKRDFMAEAGAFDLPQEEVKKMMDDLTAEGKNEDNAKGMSEVIEKIKTEIESYKRDTIPHCIDEDYCINEGLQMALDVLEEYTGGTE